MAVSIPAVLVCGLLALAWLFSVDEYKAPPGDFISVPSGMAVVGEETGGGSGGTTTRWVLIRAERSEPSAVIASLQAAMEAEGWEHSDEPPECCARPGTLGLMRRGDAWASFETDTSIRDHLYEQLDLGDLAVGGDQMVVVELEYSDWGVGRRVLFAS